MNRNRHISTSVNPLKNANKPSSPDKEMNDLRLTGSPVKPGKVIKKKKGMY